MRNRLILLAFLIAVAIRSSFAAEATVPLASGIAMDQAGADLRRALTAWEYASAHLPPQKWAVATLRENQSTTVCTDVFLLLQEADATGARLMVVEPAGPMQATFLPGDERRMGPLFAILLPRSVSRGGAEFLVKAAEPAPVLMEGGGAATSPSRIQGFDSPPALRVESTDGRAVSFAEAFLYHYNSGESAENAARLAWEAVPPRSRLDTGTADLALPTRPEPIRIDGYAVQEAEPASAALVTLRLVRGEAAALRSLSGSMAYDSAGTSPNDPRWRATTGAGGGTVSVGSPGDRFRGTLNAMERSGELNVENESFIRVQLGGRSSFRFDGPNGGVNGYVRARAVGRNQVEVTIDQEGGDWSFLGAVATTLRFRPGQTLTVAQSTTSRTSSSSSGTPILSQIPYAGPAFGSSSSSRQSSNYALYATVDVE
ncbi:MAG: Bacterial type and secretion system protein [Candidatus Sumerlaeota bacterium]|nr:Bacterial type and secretion system protein [Candidatus Sumerlaeota bacterium]